MAGIFGAFSLITARLAYLQLVRSHELLIQSEKNFTRIQTVDSPRGNIIDSEGRLLATNRPTVNLYWIGGGKRSFTEKDLTDLTSLQNILQKPILDDIQFFDELRTAERRYQKFVLAQDITLEQLGNIQELFPSHAQISVATHFKRLYPYNMMASHVLGYLGILDSTHYGKMGLEKLYEEELRGEFGSLAHTINSVGKNITTKEVKKNQAGKDIQTTLDIDIQEIMQETFPEESNGAFIVMDPEDGSLLGVLSRPEFDPSLFLDPILLLDWNNLQEHKPFLNRAFAATYPLGSIFKLVTASAALEQGLITPESSCNCTGEIVFGGAVRKCHRHFGHGHLNAFQALAESCNIFFYEIGKRIDIDTLARYAHIFGFGQATGTLFPEKAGLVPSRAWKLETLGEKWWQGETLSVAIGQSYLLATPIQVARMISSIFTGNLVTPRICLDEEVVREPIKLQRSTRMFLQESMRLVITAGTGRSMNYVKNIAVYGKTSTAQTSSLEKRKTGKQFMEHGWFAGYLAYKNYRPLALVIIIENVGSSSVATNTVRRFLNAYKKRMDQREKEQYEAEHKQSEPTRLELIVPITPETPKPLLPTPVLPARSDTTERAPITSTITAPVLSAPMFSTPFDSETTPVSPTPVNSETTLPTANHDDTIPIETTPVGTTNR
jgi:penicillin-binding protein 2